MLFNSLDFAIFLPLVFLCYWFVFNKDLKLQNLFVAIVSYIFYGWWELDFLLLIFISTIADYFVGIKIFSTSNYFKKRLYLCLSLFVNLGMLAYFKYFNFFIDNFNKAFTIFGSDFNIHSLQIILPVGISFYTFQTLSYTIDIYKGKLKPTKDFVAFSAFVSFFPQLVAGPIERAKNLLPQFRDKREFHYEKAVDGLRQILWGLFKKLVIADNCAVYVNYIFENQADLSGSTLLFGAILFIFQIYGDFSGYSDIAIGTARLFGFNLMQNFAYPLFSRDIPEFWRRWHISLTTWFRDYVYIPLIRLGGTGNFYRIRNIFILFFLTGIWHGANWTFIAWGTLNAVYFIPYLIFKKKKSHKGIVAENSNFPSFKEVYNIFISFILSVLAIILFRAQTITEAWSFYKGMIDFSLLSLPYYRGIGYSRPLLILIVFFMLIEWYGRRESHALAGLSNIKSTLVRKLIYFLIILLIGVYMWAETSDFIYFQF